MRIVVDLQGAQTGSRFRGIGNYTLSLIKAMIRRAPDDEFILLLNGMLSETIEPLRLEFDGLLPQANIRIWHSPASIEHFDQPSHNRRTVAEIMREHYIRSLQPDVILVSSLFEGLGDDAVVTVNKFVIEAPVACIFYDLTPLILPDEHFKVVPRYRNWYRDRIENVRRSDLLLAISESSRREALDELNFPEEQAVNIFGAHDSAYNYKNYSQALRSEIRQKLGINKPFILYNGGLEVNKNLKTLIEALATLPVQTRSHYQFVCVGKRHPGEIERILSFAKDPMTRDMIKTTGYVSQSDLVDLYNCCELFVFPSLREGFGLPALEAMACGAPTIAANQTSLPEVLDNPVALFDPNFAESIGRKIGQVLDDPALQASLRESGLRRAAELSWGQSADAALKALRSLAQRPKIDPAGMSAIAETAIFKPVNKKILAQKLDHHGDFLLALPALAKLRAKYPDSQLDLLVGSWNRDAAEASGLFDTIYTLDYFKSKSSVQASISQEPIEALRLSMPYYDYAIDFRRQSDTRFILFGINSHLYFGYKTGRDDADSLLTNALPIHPDFSGVRSLFDETHSCEQMLRIIDALPFDANDYVKLPAMGDKKAVVPGAVAIFPVVGNDARQWPSERFSSLVEKLAADPAISIINIYAGRQDELKGFSFREDLKIVYHCGLPFSALFTSLSANEICLGNNSFGVHLASFVGCRTIGIYSGHELPQQWGPAFNGAKVITVDAPCSPCHLPNRDSCPFDVYCLDDISVQSVFNMVKAELRGAAPAHQYSKIRDYNPATAVKPLMDHLNRSRFRGEICDLTDEDKLQVAAAITLNFPERARDTHNLYVDLSGFVPSNRDSLEKTDREYQLASALIERLRRESGNRYEVIGIASGQHDHEFYTADLESLTDIFSSGRSDRVVRPMPGDMYIGIDAYPYRNFALWSLLLSWRQAGTKIAFLIPEKVFQERSDGGAVTTVGHRFLAEAAKFDVLLASSDTQCLSLKEWADIHKPPRVRPLQISIVPDIAIEVRHAQRCSEDEINLSLISVLESVDA